MLSHAVETSPSARFIRDYIYQFHMAAFFFISGYTSRIWKKDLEEIVIDKARTLLLPWFTLLVGVLLFRFAKALLYVEATLAQALEKAKETLDAFFIHGMTDSMLGASWFLPTLFFVFVFHRLIWRATEKRSVVVYGMMTVVVLFF